MASEQESPFGEGIGLRNMEDIARYLVLGSIAMDEGEESSTTQAIRRDLGSLYDETCKTLVSEGLLVGRRGRYVLTDAGYDYVRQLAEDAYAAAVDSTFEAGEAAYELRLTFLFDIVEVWRTIKVPQEASFQNLHVMIQATMNWMNCHFYDFKYLDKDGRAHTLSLDEEDSDFGYNPAESMFGGLLHESYGEEEDTRDVLLSEVIPTMQKMVYTYDYGDSWEVAIDLVGATTLEDGLVVCTGGVGDAPPEDVGGEEGFLEFLQVMADEDDPEYEETRSWAASQGYEPFAIDTVNAHLARWRVYGSVVDDEEYDDFESDEVVDEMRTHMELFGVALERQNLSEKSQLTHLENVASFGVDYLHDELYMGFAEGIVQVPDYLGDYLLDTGEDLPTVQEYKSIINSLKKFYRVMRMAGVVEASEYDQMIAAINKNQDTWLKKLETLSS